MQRAKVCLCFEPHVRDAQIAVAAADANETEGQPGRLVERDGFDVPIADRHHLIGPEALRHEKHGVGERDGPVRTAPDGAMP